MKQGPKISVQHHKRLKNRSGGDKTNDVARLPFNADRTGMATKIDSVSSLSRASESRDLLDKKKSIMGAPKNVGLNEALKPKTGHGDPRSAQGTSPCFGVGERNRNSQAYVMKQ